MSALMAWSGLFQQPVRMRGRSYQQQDRVERVEPVDGELVRARVQGTQEYQVTIRANGRKAVAECTCEHFAGGALCKHIWATLIDVQQRPDAPGAKLPELLRLRPSPPRARRREASDDEPVTPTPRTGPKWEGRLAMLRPGEGDLPTVTGLPGQRQVWYTLLPEASSHRGSLVIELRQKKATATGWSRSRPLRLDLHKAGQLEDPEDRRLCGLLLGGEPVLPTAVAMAGSQPASMYQLPDSASAALLRQMIATGRCCLDLDEQNAGARELPLWWDAGPAPEDEQALAKHHGEGEPWVLWLHGVEDVHGGIDVTEALQARQDDDDILKLAEAADLEAADRGEGGGETETEDEDEGEDEGEQPGVAGDLVLDVQLRRAGRRVSVAEPLLVSGRGGVVVYKAPGGASGGGAIVAGLDDRNAGRWITMFRDERWVDEPEGRTIRVPAAEAERFLERLYLLPSLPELDLPERWTRSEQRIKPSPCLQLHRPQTRAAVDLAGSGVRSDLVGRLWFDYDGQPVRPTQRGRFVIVDENAPSEEEVEGEGEDPNGEPMPMAPDEPDEPEESAGPVEDENEVEDEVEGGDDDGDADDADDELVEPAEGQRLVRRDPRAEREAMGLAASVGLRQAGDRADLLLLPVKQMGPAVQRLLAAGWNVTADSQRVRFAGPPNLSVRSGIDWFELHGRVRFGEGEGASEATLPEVLAAARRGESTVQLGDGTVGLLPEQWLQQHGMIAALGETHDDHLRFDKAQGVLLSGLAGEEGLAEVDEPFAQLRKRLHEFDAIDPIEPPDALEGELRPYQKQGLGWLEFLRRFELSGILADDMGLGKTVQVLATLAERRPAKTDASVVSTSESADASKDTGESSGGGASLIVAPKSVVFNWLDEAQKFVPHLRVGAYSGTERHGMLDRIDDYDVLVTSYGLLRRDAEALGKLDLDYAVLDEAQAIKNPTSQSAKAARSLKARHRLALTGTPIENHLGDLWSIFEFLNPGMLGASTRFQDLLKAAPDTTDLQDAPPGQKSTGLEDLGRALRPFILRRTKKQVLSDLPTKTEQTIVCQMEPAQRKIYDELRDYYRGSLMQSLDGAGVQSTATLGGSAFMVLEALLRLRQAACHPGLITGEAAGVAAATRNGTAGAESGEYPSAKLDELQLRLGDVLEEGSKALVFSQFTSMLAIVRKRLEKQGIKYVYLDGQTRNRKDVVQQFQEDPTVQVFLISLKAGGTGLNLTAAEYVFLLDPWWNPAVEAQAIDRAHRIGQTRPVFAYRMICEDTVEQRILQLQQQKRQLAEAVVGGDQSLLRQLTRDDLEQLLA